MAFYGDILVGVGLLVFLATGRAASLVVGFAAGGLLALPSLRSVVRGRYELGPSNAPFALWGLWLFLGGATAYLLTFLALTSTFPTEGQLASLRIALFLLAVAFVTENLSGMLFLWNVAPHGGIRRHLALQAAAVVLLLIPYFWYGLGVVNDFVKRSGGVAVNPAEAHSYLTDFVGSVLVAFALIFLVARIPALVALWRSIDELAYREQEEEAEGFGAIVQGEP